MKKGHAKNQVGCPGSEVWGEVKEFAGVGVLGRHAYA